MIVYDSTNISKGNVLQQQYIDAIQQAFDNQSMHNNIIGLQWINLESLNESEEDLNEKILNAVDLVAVEVIWNLRKCIFIVALHIGWKIHMPLTD